MSILILLYTRLSTVSDFLVNQLKKEAQASNQKYQKYQKERRIFRRHGNLKDHERAANMNSRGEA